MRKTSEPLSPPAPRLNEAIDAIVARIPEGFIAIELLAQRLGLRVGSLRSHLEQANALARLIPQGSLVYDPARLTPD
jgi:hypothetical protein